MTFIMQTGKTKTKASGKTRPPPSKQGRRAGASARARYRA
ncbi:hypothetical protein BSIN_1840 [Burkholderia singularis]|uniref:Uncharacterized protein n=1 Tax=Burkholderia singularis TaxID=1503053 RepID=A0A238H032_9BURK|nr:hypothetical protein BSIN_1840 [Burkholderia singularis]